MTFFEVHSFLMILKESIKLLPKNGKIMTFIALFTILLSSSSIVTYNYSLKFLIRNMMVSFQKSFMPDLSSLDIPDPKSFDPTNPSSFQPNMGSNPTQMIAGLQALMRDDFALILAVHITFVLVISTISFVSSISIIIVSALSYRDRNLSLNELIPRTLATWTRPFITTLYVSALSFGYTYVVVMLVAPFLIYSSHFTYYTSIFLGIIAFVYYLYLSVTWVLAIVVSVVEESFSGLEALVKSAQLVKGKRLQGFLLNICFNIVIVIIFQGYKIVWGNKVFVNPTLMYLLPVMIVSFLAKIVQVTAYTVLYFHCKKHHGEEIELNGKFQYAKLPTALLPDNMP